MMMMMVVMVGRSMVKDGGRGARVTKEVRVSGWLGGMMVEHLRVNGQPKGFVEWGLSGERRP